MQSYSAKSIKVSSHFRVGVLSKAVGGLRKAVLGCTHKPSKCLQSACLPPKQLKTPAPSSCSLSFCGGKKKNKKGKSMSPGVFSIRSLFFFFTPCSAYTQFSSASQCSGWLSFNISFHSDSLEHHRQRQLENWNKKKKKNPTSVKTVPGSPKTLPVNWGALKCTQRLGICTLWLLNIIQNAFCGNSVLFPTVVCFFFLDLIMLKIDIVIV